MRGRVAVVLGLFLVVVFGAAIVVLAPSLLHPGSEQQLGPTFTGTARQGAIGLIVLGVGLLFGLSVLAAVLSKGPRAKRFFRYTTLGFAILILAPVAGYVLNGASKDSEHRDRTPKEDLAKVAADMNKDLPKMVDKETRLDRVIAGPGQRMTFYYTLVNHASGDLYAAAVSKNLPDEKTNFCKVFKKALSDGDSVGLIYRGNDGRRVAELLLTAEECR